MTRKDWLVAGLFALIGAVMFAASLAVYAEPTQDQVDELRQTIRDLEDQARAIKDASDETTIQTDARAIERIALVAKTLGVELDRLIDDGPVDPPDPIEPPVIDPPDPPTDDGWLAPEPDADAIRLDASTTRSEAVAAFNSTRDVLFEAGAVYNFELGQLWRSGTAEDPRLIGVYGDGARPQFVVSHTWLSTRGGDRVRHVVISGLRVTNKGRVHGPGFDPGARSTTGISWLAGGGGILIEDCAFEGLGFGITFVPQNEAIIEGLTLHRVIVRNCWNAGSDSSGAFIKAVRDGVISECVFDHNGWLEGAAPRDDRRHNLYLAPRPNDDDPRSFPWIVRDTLFSNGSSHGMKGGPGGTIEGNLWTGNAIAFYVSRNESVIRGNVILNAADLGPSDLLARGWGFEAFGMGRVTVEDNIVANQQSHRPEASAAYAIETHGISGPVSGNRVYAQPIGKGDTDGVGYRPAPLAIPIDIAALVRREATRGRGVWRGGISDAVQSIREASVDRP